MKNANKYALCSIRSIVSSTKKRKKMKQPKSSCKPCSDIITHQHCLVQHLTALHVRRLNVDAVGSTLPKKQIGS